MCSRITVSSTAQVDPSDLSERQRLAMFLNLYNLLTLHSFVAHGVPEGPSEHRRRRRRCPAAPTRIGRLASSSSICLWTKRLVGLALPLSHCGSRCRPSKRSSRPQSDQGCSGGCR